RAAEDLMFAPVQAEEVVPSDDARAVNSGGGEIRAIAERYFGCQSAARKIVDQMSLRSERDVTDREVRRAPLDLDQVTRQVDIRRCLPQLAETQCFVLKRRAYDLEAIRPVERAASERSAERRLPGQIGKCFPGGPGRRRGEHVRSGLRFEIERTVFDRLDLIETPTSPRRWRRIVCGRRLRAVWRVVAW